MTGSPWVTTLTLNPAVDRSCEVDEVVPHHKLRCEEPKADPGGGGLNVARALRELGVERVDAVWARGGCTGDLLAQLLERAGVTHRPVPVRADTRESFTVSETGSDRQYRFVLPGARLSAEEVEACREAVRSPGEGPGFLVLSGSLPPGVPDGFYGEIARAAAADATRVVVDTSGEALRRVADAGVFLLKPNLRELGQLAGRQVAVDEVEQVSQALVREGRAEVVVTSLGAEGAVVATAAAAQRLEAPDVEPRSRVGAGDSMVAGMVCGLVRGYELADAVRLGLAAGAAAVLTPGTGLCRRDDAERLFAQLGGDAGSAAAAGPRRSARGD